jgi:hypothetical protein
MSQGGWKKWAHLCPGKADVILEKRNGTCKTVLFESVSKQHSKKYSPARRDYFSSRRINP